MPRWLPVAVLAGLAALGLWLVASDGSGTGVTPSTTADGSTDQATGVLEIGGTSQDAVAGLAGLDLPASTADFLSARLDDGSQLDVTFTLDPTDEQAFLDGSALPAPVAGERVITHSSPLWKLNPEGELRGASDEMSGLVRTVELVEEAGRTRVRLVIVPGG